MSTPKFAVALFLAFIFHFELAAGPILTQELLFHGGWESDEEEKVIDFRKYGVVSVYLEQTDLGGMGTYEIQGSTVFIKLGEDTEGVPKEINCKLTSIRVKKRTLPHLKCNKFTNLTVSYYRPGTRSVVGGLKVEMFGNRQGQATSNLKMRKAPSLNGLQLKYCSFEGEKIRCRKYFPKGTTFIVIGRTLDKHKVSKWNNYWYCIFYESAVMEKGKKKTKTMEGWVFAEFVDLK